MNDFNWFRPFAKALAFFGMLIIIIGVLAFREFPPFEQFALINCELGYLGLSLIIAGLGLHTKMQSSAVNQ